MNLSSRRRVRRSCSSFTLVEVLVAVSMLMIMVAFLWTLFASVCAISIAGKQDAENSSNARAVLDLMSQELEAGVNRADLTNWVSWTGSKSTLGFFTRSPGSAISPAPVSTANYRGLSFVEYTLSRSATNASLQRGDQACLWSDVPLGRLPLGYADSTVATPALSEVLPGVLVFQVTFLQQDGSYSSLYGTNSIAIGLSLAMVDSASLNLLSRAGKIEALASTLAGAYGGSGVSSASPKSAWEHAVDSRNVLDGYPQPLKTGLRFFERFVDLPKAGL